MSHIKRRAMPKNWPLARKSGKKFVMFPRGADKKELSLPLIVIIRDMIQLGHNRSEIKQMIAAGDILVNNKKANDERASVGLFDKITVPKINKHFEITIKNKKITVKEISKNEASRKIYKIIGKKMLNNKKMQVNMLGGRNLLLDKSEIKSGDSIIFDFDKNAVEKILHFEKNALCELVGGKNSGERGKIIEFDDKKRGKAIIKTEKGEIKASKKNILIIDR